MLRSSRVRTVTALAAVLTGAGAVVSGCTLPDSDRTDVGWPDDAVPSASFTVPRAWAPSSVAPSSKPGSSPGSATTDSTATGTAARALATLPVKGRAPKTGYQRELFGQAWDDDVAVDGGHNGCDTRNDILQRDLTAVVFKPRTHDCVVLNGVLHDPYTATTVEFSRGSKTSSLVPIDHVVALSDAWQKGAQQLSTSERVNLANDPLNLIATSRRTNQSKSDSDAATWLVPSKPFRCTYVARQVAVKAKYDLWVTSAERDAIERVLAKCPGQPLPTEADANRRTSGGR
ncbi:HNH endonuclease family protein [Gordonia zhaorongruii]|uniref:HNH endonuclease family protein n=1 Tax=Gordonia zhaorongruii TaxID=2597659 RepID=UPI00117F65CF|nr:HNH endonuclease family protein [Gordonia zhaorongruii]